MVLALRAEASGSGRDRFGREWVGRAAAAARSDAPRRADLMMVMAWLKVGGFVSVSVAGYALWIQHLGLKTVDEIRFLEAQLASWNRLQNKPNEINKLNWQEKKDRRKENICLFHSVTGVMRDDGLSQFTWLPLELKKLLRPELTPLKFLYTSHNCRASRNAAKNDFFNFRIN